MCCFFPFLPRHAAYGISVPWPRIEPGPWQCKSRTLTTRPPRSFFQFLYLKAIFLNSFIEIYFINQKNSTCFPPTCLVAWASPQSSCRIFLSPPKVKVLSPPKSKAHDLSCLLTVSLHSPIPHPLSACVGSQLLSCVQCFVTPWAVAH